jgi:hypothetical protein
MTRFRLTLLCIILTTTAWPALAAPTLYSIGAEQVSAAIDRIGVQIAPSQVMLLSNIEVATPAPMLQVRSVEQIGAGRFMVRVECESQDNCLPFMASVRCDEGTATTLSNAASRLSLLKGSFSASALQPSRPLILIRNGSRATLLLNGAHIHISIPVICLQSGAAGQTVRATTTDHRQIYAAQVVDVGILQGKL